MMSRIKIMSLITLAFVCSHNAHPMDSKAANEQRMLEEEAQFRQQQETKRQAGMQLKDDLVRTMQSALDALFKRAAGDVAVQYRLLTIVEGANKNEVELQRQRDALVLLQTDPTGVVLKGPEEAFLLLQGLVEKTDWLEGRKTLRWKARWNQEGKIRAESIRVDEYQNMLSWLASWNEIVNALRRQVTALTNKELEHCSPTLLRLLIDEHTKPDKMGTKGIVYLLKEYIIDELRAPKRKKPEQDIDRFGGL